MIEILKQSTPPTIPTYSSGVETGSNSPQKLNTQTTTSTQQPQGDDVLKKEDIPKLVDELNKVSESLNVDVKFAYNDKIDEVYINITDKNTGRVIRKLPSEEAMKIKETMKDLVGSLFDIKG